MKTNLPAILIAFGSAALLKAADNKNPMGETSWEHAPSSYKTPPDLVKGGAFIDRILPMPVGPAGLTSDCWGGDNVKPRDVHNGIEDPKWSYWCMSVHREADGREHMFGARWPENSPKGHMSWSNSHAFHAVADSPLGPFRVVEEDIGPGHNITWYRAKDGSHVIYRIGGGYVGPGVNGPWKPFAIQYDTRGTDPGEQSNNKFTVREDGSVLMVSRGGRIWISEDGLKPFRKITLESAYPKIAGRFEDPEIWRDEVQYHLIVNDWFGRSAYSLRSKDGVTWVWDQGLAYDVTVARHSDGSRENWYKFERPHVRQDQFGRATHMYFAVIDSGKEQDQPNDNHSSKIIALPLVVQRRMEILEVKEVTQTTTRLRVKIKAEPGFDPAKDMKLDTLRFGAPSAVDYGKGMKATASEATGPDVIVAFDGPGGFQAGDFVAKLLGTDRQGGMLYGYARLPGVAFIEPMVSAPPPAFDGKEIKFRVENFGQVASVPGTITLSCRGGQGSPISIERPVPVIPPYGGTDISLPIDQAAFGAGSKVSVETTIRAGGTPFTQKATISMPAATAGAGPASASSSPATAGGATRWFDMVAEHDHDRILKSANEAMGFGPITITSARSPLSEGGPNDFFSMSDYFWPDPSKPDGKPYVRRDGESYPGNFNEHRMAVMKLRDATAALAAAYLITRDERYAEQAVRLLTVFFVDPATRMNPNLEHAQVMIGTPAPTRGIGLIDTLHLVETAVAIRALEDSRALTPEKAEPLKRWFRDYLAWLRTSPRGMEEARQSNNHAVAYWLQIAAFGRLTGDEALLAECRRQFKEVFLPKQMAADGSFPLELKRTKPYAYSIFQLDNMASLCRLLSTPADNLWSFETADGRGMRKAMAYLYPFLEDKSKWPLKPDVQAWDGWPVRQACLLFAGTAFPEEKYLDLWRRLKPDPTEFEIRRNNAITQPLLWMDRPLAAR